MIIEAVNKRYTELSDQECCLSCGGAINFSEVKNGEVCIDLGSGKGSDALRLANMVGSEGFVYGIDISEGMIEKSKALAQKLMLKNIEFLHNEFEKISLPSGIADLLISNCSLNHSENKQWVWNEIYRLLKMGGRFVISDIYTLQEVPEEYRNNSEFIAECWAGAVTRETYLSQIQNAGFKKIEILEESQAYKKGMIEVCSWTIAGVKPIQKCSCCNG